MCVCLAIESVIKIVQKNALFCQPHYHPSPLLPLLSPQPGYCILNCAQLLGSLRNALLQMAVAKAGALSAEGSLRLSMAPPTRGVRGSGAAGAGLGAANVKRRAAALAVAQRL